VQASKHKYLRRTVRPVTFQGVYLSYNHRGTL